MLNPALRRAYAAGLLSRDEYSVLKVVVALTIVKAADLSAAFTGTSVARSQLIRKMIDRQLIEPIADGKRSYRLVMAPGPLTTYILRQLDEIGFLPQILREEL